MADENLERITILLQAKDRDFARAMDRNNKLIARLTRDAKKNTTDMASTIDARLSKVSATMTGFASSFAKGLVGGVVAGAFASITSNVGQVIAGIAQIGDEAKRSGLSAEAFQEWRFVAEQNRVGVDALVDGFKELSLRADEFMVTGGGSAAEAFKRLGISGADLAEKLKDPSALMVELIERMEGLDKAAQIRISDELFGGTGGEQFVQLLERGADGIQGQIDRARELGLIIDSDMIAKAAELDAKFAEVQARIGNVWRTGVVEAAQFFGLLDRELPKLEFDPDLAARLFGQGTADALGALPEVPADALAQIESLTTEYADLAAEAQQLVPALSDASMMLRGVGDAAGAGVLTDLASRIGEAARAFEDGETSGADYAEALREIVAEAEASLTAMSDLDQARLAGVIGQVQSLLEWIGRLPAAAAAARAEINSLSLMDTGVPLTDDGNLLPPSPEAPRTSPRPKPAPPMLGEPELPKKTKKGGGGSDRAPFTDALEDMAKETAALQAEAAALLSVADASGQYADAAEYARAKAELLIAAQQQGIEITPALEAQIDELARGYVDAGMAAEEAAAKLEEIEASGERGAAAVSDIFMSLASGASTAKEALAQLLIEMAKVQMQKAMLGLMDSGAGGGIFGAIGSLLGFDGGGYTGNAPRSGGVDGKGGFLAVMHPQETVIDHTKGANAPRPAMAEMARPAGGAQQSRVDVEVRAYVDDNGNLQAMVDRRAAAIAGSTSAATARMQQRTLSQQMQRNDLRGTSA